MTSQGKLLSIHWLYNWTHFRRVLTSVTVDDRTICQLQEIFRLMEEGKTFVTAISKFDISSKFDLMVQFMTYNPCDDWWFNCQMLFVTCGLWLVACDL
jgi:hypothetical protein